MIKFNFLQSCSSSDADHPSFTKYTEQVKKYHQKKFEDWKINSAASKSIDSLFSRRKATLPEIDEFKRKYHLLKSIHHVLSAKYFPTHSNTLKLHASAYDSFPDRDLFQMIDPINYDRIFQSEDHYYEDPDPDDDTKQMLAFWGLTDHYESSYIPPAEIDAYAINHNATSAVQKLIADGRSRIFRDKFWGEQAAASQPRSLTKESLYTSQTYPLFFQFDLTADLHFYLHYWQQTSKGRQVTLNEEHSDHPSFENFIKISRPKDEERIHRRQLLDRINGKENDKDFILLKLFEIKLDNEQLKVSTVCQKFQFNAFLSYSTSPWQIDRDNNTIKTLYQGAKISELYPKKHSLRNIINYYPEKPDLNDFYIMEHTTGINLATSIFNCCSRMTDIDDKGKFSIFVSQLTADLPYAFGRSYILDNAFEIAINSTSNSHDTAIETLTLLSKAPDENRYNEMRTCFFALVSEIVFNYSLEEITDSSSTFDHKYYQDLLVHYFEFEAKAVDFHCLSVCDGVPYYKKRENLISDPYRYRFLSKDSTADYLYRFIERNIIYTLADKPTVPETYLKNWEKGITKSEHIVGVPDDPNAPNFKIKIHRDNTPLEKEEEREPEWLSLLMEI